MFAPDDVRLATICCVVSRARRDIELKRTRLDTSR
jgi:hypothetical protein